MKKVLVTSIFLFFLSCISKMDIIYHIYIYNSSEKPIGFYIPAGGEYGLPYPDTLLPNTDNYIYNREIRPKKHL